MRPGAQLLINGFVWVVEDRAGSRFMLRCPALQTSKVGVPRLDKEVQVLGPRHPKYLPDPRDNALNEVKIENIHEAYVQVHLGGTIIARKDNDAEIRHWTIPANVMRFRRDVRSHLILFHDVFTTDEHGPDIENSVTAEHDEYHRHPVPVPHTHLED